MLHAARWKYKMQKIAKKSPSAHHRTKLSGYIFATKACMDNRENLLHRNTSSTCCHNMVYFGPLTTEICWRIWNLGYPRKFQRVSPLGFVTAPASLNGGQPNFARCLAVSCTGILCMHFFWGGGTGALAPNGNFARQTGQDNGPIA